MTHQSCKIGCVYKIPFRKSSHNYSQTEKEGLALVFEVKKFHNYLFGRTFTLCTDHKLLQALFNAIPCMASARIQRWALTLATYDQIQEWDS